MKIIREFIALFKFNYRRMLNTWMLRVMALIILGCVLAGAFLVREMNAVTKVGVLVHEASEKSRYSDSLIELLNYTGGNHYYYLTDRNSGEKNIITINITEGIKDTVEVRLESSSPELVSSLQKLEMLDMIRRTYSASNSIVSPIVNITDDTVSNQDSAYEISFYITLFILYLFILLCGSIITSSVALEKTSKVSELITYRISPFKLIYSKVLALYLLLLQIGLLAAVEILICHYTGLVDVGNIRDVLLQSGLGVKEISYIFIIVMSGIAVYTVMYVIVGILISSAEQIQFSQLPVAAMALIAFIIAVLCKTTPDAAITKICIYIPPVSPFVAVLRLLNSQSNILETVFAAFSIFIFFILSNCAISWLYKRES